ncbi:uncharacterized protein [Drosophila kikkawai]|uniref:Uncharacterized protein isoform X2 n=1 Tax=Drosophila kikkawai TaxID=30033 RepID=A0ABM4GPQ9_DROKI
MSHRESISTETDTHRISLYELASCRAENYLLKQRMTECEATMQSLKQMVATIADKQLEILGEVKELRKNCAPSKIQIVDSSTSTVHDGCMPDSDSDDWNSQVFSPYFSPLASSDPELDPPLEQYDLGRNRGPAWSILYSIKEENEQEDSQEDVMNYQVELDQTDAQPVSQIYQHRLEDTWADESDN